MLCKPNAREHNVSEIRFAVTLVPLVKYKENDMNVVIGSARIGETGKISGGKVGDQKQTSIPDYKGEVSLQKFYVHSKGWYILRPKNLVIAQRIALAMRTACNNQNIGYDQTNRVNILISGTSAKVPTECDCSSLVRQCVKEATGQDVGNFTTLNEVKCLMASGLFQKLTYTQGLLLQVGDILVTKTKGHTAVVVSADDEFPTLRKGSKGSYVRLLQRELNKVITNIQLDDDGDFGPLTEISTIDFQKRKGLRADGIVGPKTWKALLE